MVKQGKAGEFSGESPGGLGCLYVVATPVGNLEDMTYRAVRVLGQVNLVVAEDTRKARIILGHYGIKKPLTSFNTYNYKIKVPRLIERLSNGEELALVSEAGTPGVSDPGAELVRAAHGGQIPVIPIPGASAVTAAVSASGLPGGTFHFYGFLPKRKGRRERVLQRAFDCGGTAVFFEPARSLVERLAELQSLFGDQVAVVCREMTKVHEEVRVGPLTELIRWYEADPPKGEVTLVINLPAPF